MTIATTSTLFCPETLEDVGYVARAVLEHFAHIGRPERVMLGRLSEQSMGDVACSKLVSTWAKAFARAGVDVLIDECAHLAMLMFAVHTGSADIYVCIRPELGQYGGLFAMGVRGYQALIDDYEVIGKCIGVRIPAIDQANGSINMVSLTDRYVAWIARHALECNGLRGESSQLPNFTAQGTRGLAVFNALCEDSWSVKHGLRASCSMAECLFVYGDTGCTSEYFGNDGMPIGVEVIVEYVPELYAYPFVVLNASGFEQRHALGCRVGALAYPDALFVYCAYGAVIAQRCADIAVEVMRPELVLKPAVIDGCSKDLQAFDMHPASGVGIHEQGI